MYGESCGGSLGGGAGTYAGDYHRAGRENSADSSCWAANAACHTPYAPPSSSRGGYGANSVRADLLHTPPRRQSSDLR